MVSNTWFQKNVQEMLSNLFLDATITKHSARLNTESIRAGLKKLFKGAEPDAPLV